MTRGLHRRRSKLQNDYIFERPIGNASARFDVLKTDELTFHLYQAISPPQHSALTRKLISRPQDGRAHLPPLPGDRFGTVLQLLYK